MRYILLFLALVATATAQPSHPKLRHAPKGARIIADRYIVAVTDDAPGAAKRFRKIGATVDGEFALAFRGVSAKIPPGQLQKVLNDPATEYVEPDVEVSVAAQTLDWGVDAIGGDSSSTRSGNGSGVVSGVRVYVIDTGIDPANPDLAVAGGVNYGNQLKDTSHWEDEHGHGTHVAGIIGARDNAVATVGVAPGVTLYAVRVFGPLGTGSVTNIIKGIEWVRRQRAALSGPMVANMSLSSGGNLSLDRAVTNLIASGVVVVAAAGNNGADAGSYSPARVPDAITVAACGRDGRLASFSNYGARVDIIAPGVGILSSARGGGVVTKSGTSMATPHVAGAVALWLSTHPTASPVDAANAVTAAAVPWGVGLPGGTVNRVVNVRGW